MSLGEKVQWFVHGGNVILLGAVNQTDMVMMRLMMVIASTCGLAYNILQPKPLVPPAIWGVFFIGSHMYNLYLLFKERRPMTLSEDQEKVYEDAFFKFGFTPRQFMDILEQANAQWCNYSMGSFVFQKGEKFKQAHYLMEGEGEMVSTTGDVMFKMQPGKGGWIGEFYDPFATAESLAQERIRPVSFKCTATRCRTLALDFAQVHQVIRSSPKMSENATRAEVADLWGKLHRSVPETRRLTYEAMMSVAASDGVIAENEVKLLEDFRVRHKIPETAHEASLEKIGWSKEEWAARRQRKKPRCC